MVVAGLAAIIAAGCGANVTPSANTSVDGEDRGDNSIRLGDDHIAKTVVLDWTGGYCKITSQWLNGADLSLMYLDSGETLEQYAEDFEEAVRTRTEEILSKLEPADFVVVVDEAEHYPDDTVVYLTADAVAGEAFRVGQTKMDRCDLRDDDTVIVWVGTVLKLGNNHGYQEWVNALANIAAHEVGHTIGFFHPDAERSDFTEYEKDTEVMMGVHTLSALLSRQEFIIPQETCPEAIEHEFGGVAYEVPANASAKYRTWAYKANVASEDDVVYYCHCHGHEHP